MLDELKNKLSQAREPYVFFIDDIEDRVLERIVKVAAGDQKVGIVDGRRMRTWDGFFSEFSKEFDFPDYFGWNINAFSEVMRDLSWVEAEGYVVLALHSEEILLGKPDCANILSEYGKSFGEEWATPVRTGQWWDHEARPFHTILHRTLPTDSLEGAVRLSVAGSGD